MLRTRRYKVCLRCSLMFKQDRRGNGSPFCPDCRRTGERALLTAAPEPERVSPAEEPPARSDGVG